jgi:hypothetical protein
MAEVRARLITHLRVHIAAEVSDAEIVELLRTACAWSPQGGRVLDEHLARHPDALHAPDPHCPMVLVRLAHTLAAAGHPVVLPRCVRCGQTSKLLPRLTSEGRCCGWCVERDRTTICSRCGQDGSPVARRAEGMICRRCYNRDPEFVQPCAGCGHTRPPITRDAGGRPLCWTCAPRPVHPCRICGTVAVAKTNGPDGSVCPRCYQHPQRQCGGCGTIAVIVLRGDGESPDRCRRCRPEPLHRCVGCTRFRPANAIWPIGPVCRRCYHATIRSPATCAGCQQHRVLIGRNQADERLCGPCAGVDTDYLCQACGQAGQLHYAGCCLRCSARLRATELLANDDGRVPTHLAPLVEVLATTTRPDSTLRWLTKPTPSKLLHALARDAAPLTHTTLDRMPPSHTAHYLRQLLVHTGILPARIEPLERIQPWLERLLATLPGHHARIIGPYAQWSVLRRARRRAIRRRYTNGSAEGDRAKIRAAIQLLAWLDTHQRDLADLTQPLLDHWLDGDHRRATHIAGFIAWITRRSLTPTLTIRHRPSPEPSQFLDVDDQIEHIRRLVTSSAPIPLDVRVAGLLVLLFGVHVSHIHQLTAADITHRDQHTYLTLATHPVLLPPPLATLITQLAASPTTSQFGTSGIQYLFPSRRFASTPVTAEWLTKRLNTHGLPATAGRNSALATLAADLPAAVIAELFGIHINTATRWSRHARRDWSHYLEARATMDRDRRVGEDDGRHGTFRDRQHGALTRSAGPCHGDQPPPMGGDRADRRT